MSCHIKYYEYKIEDSNSFGVGLLAAHIEPKKEENKLIPFKCLKSDSVKQKKFSEPFHKMKKCMSSQSIYVSIKIAFIASKLTTKLQDPQEVTFVLE